DPPEPPVIIVDNSHVPRPPAAGQPASPPEAPGQEPGSERAPVTYPPSALAAIKARGEGVIDDEIGAQAKPSGMPRPVEPPPAPKVAGERPALPPPQGLPAVPGLPAGAANQLEEMIRMAGVREKQLDELLKVPGLGNGPLDQFPNGPAQLDQELERLFRMAGM